MDVCTLIVVTTLTTQMYYTLNICTQVGDRELCSGMQRLGATLFVRRLMNARKRTAPYTSGRMNVFRGQQQF